MPTIPVPWPVPAAALLTAQIASPLGLEFTTSTLRDEFDPITCSGKAGAVVPRPTLVPLSNNSELLPVIGDVNLTRKPFVPEMFAAPCGPCGPVAPVAPCRPCGPVAPVAPCGPCGPCGPIAP